MNLPENNLASADYVEIISRTPANNQNLWVVHDAYIDNPQDRFEPDKPLQNSIYESEGPLSSASIPPGLTKFVEDTCAQFGVTHSTYVSIQDIICAVFYFLDFTEPYYLFVDSAVQLTQDNFHYTYRKKRTGYTLDPEKIEVFRVMTGWNFAPFGALCDLISHPISKQILSNQSVQHPKVNRQLTKRDLTDKMCQILWGNPEVANMWISEWTLQHYSNIEHDMRFGRNAVNNPDDFERLDKIRDSDENFWLVAALSTLGWLRSPYAMKFLVEYHSVYQAVLSWDEQKNRPFVIEGSGGEAIVLDYDVYTHQHVDVAQAEPPGTCARCKQNLHCTKYVNIKAFESQNCTCGRNEVDPLDKDFYSHKWDCRARIESNFQFGCQKCISELVGKQPREKCLQFACSNTGCQWHAGNKARIQELTRRRTLLLTDGSAKE